MHARTHKCTHARTHARTNERTNTHSRSHALTNEVSSLQVERKLNFRRRHRRPLLLGKTLTHAAKAPAMNHANIHVQEKHAFSPFLSVEKATDRPSVRIYSFTNCSRLFLGIEYKRVVLFWFLTFIKRVHLDRFELLQSGFI